MSPVDAVHLQFSPSSLLLLNVILGLIMFGVALDLRLADFRSLLRLPRSALVGLGAQFVVLPAATAGLVYVLQPAPSLGLGMILVAACPGGNISNFFTHVARGNVALSVGLSAVSTACAVVTTPLNFAVWGRLVPGAAPLLREIALHPLDLALSVGLLLGVPLALGLWVAHRHASLATRLRKPMKWFSMVFLAAFVVAALSANLEAFVHYIDLIFGVVLLHNAVALSIGYAGAYAVSLPEADRRAVAIEVGIQNSGLGLILIFNFFDGLGGMAVVAAWWGIWHIISGLTLSLYWSRAPRTALSQG